MIFQRHALSTYVDLNGEWATQRVHSLPAQHDVFEYASGKHVSSLASDQLSNEAVENTFITVNLGTKLDSHVYYCNMTSQSGSRP